MCTTGHAMCIWQMCECFLWTVVRLSHPKGRPGTPAYSSSLYLFMQKNNGSSSLQQFYLQFKGKSHIGATDWSGGALHYLDLRLF